MKLYFEAEQFLDAKEGLKTRVFSAKIKSSPTHVYALVVSALKQLDHIDHVIEKSRISEAPQLRRLKVSSNCLRLLVHDFLFSPKGRIQLGKHPIKEAFLLHKTRLQAELTKLKLKHNVRNVADLPLRAGVAEDETPIRWFRVNTLKATDESVLLQPVFKHLTRVDSIDEIKPSTIYADTHVAHLYGVDPKVKITKSEAYKNGHIILQDRASCFPAQILCGAFDASSDVIDACAAPGNKTTHAAALVHGQVHAFERDPKRVHILKQMCERAGASVVATHKDFCSVDPAEYPLVTGLIVDPSCSGSGIFGRSVESDKEEGVDRARLEKLALFQFTIMKHALSFPNAKRVVYSTCSVHAEENERVVVDLLRDPGVQSRGWRLASRATVLPKWERRGWAHEFSDSALAEGCVRAVQREDGGIGFFAACFERARTHHGSSTENASWDLTESAS